MHTTAVRRRESAPPECSLQFIGAHHAKLSLRARAAHPHAFSHLCGGLAERGISVVAGHARREAASMWSVELQLDVAGANTNVASMDFVSLLADPRPLEGRAELDIRNASVSRLPDGSIELRIEAPDQLGLLHTLLSRVAMLMLFPTSVDLDTIAGMASDRLVLRGAQGASPSEEAHTRLLRTFSARD